MSIENPTLKIRLVVPDNVLGKDCVDAARGLAMGMPLGYKVLDAKWGRTPSDWQETKGWGRKRLSERDAGFVEAIRSLDRPDGVEARLLDIIERLTK